MDYLDKEKLIHAVREKGYEIATIDDLMNIGKKNKDLIPILLKYIDETSDESSKRFIVRCLGVKGFFEASATLIREFYQATDSSYKWTIGNSLGLISDKDVLPDMLKIVQEKEHGTARQMIVYNLGKFDCPETRRVLIGLLSDKDVVGHAIHAISKLHDKSLIKFIEPFQTYEVTWIRNAAKSAIKKLEKC